MYEHASSITFHHLCMLCVQHHTQGVKFHAYYTHTSSRLIKSFLWQLNVISYTIYLGNAYSIDLTLDLFPCACEYNKTLNARDRFIGTVSQLNVSYTTLYSQKTGTIIRNSVWPVYELVFHCFVVPYWKMCFYRTFFLVLGQAQHHLRQYSVCP